MHNTRQNYHMVIDRLIIHSQNDQLYASKQDQDRAQSIQSSDMNTVDVHHVCHNIERHVNYGRRFRLIWKANGHYQ